MSRSLRVRLIALLVSSTVAFSVLVPGAAFADEVVPSPTPTVEPTAEPTPTPTADASVEPTAEPTAQPTATPEPTSTQTEAPAPTPAPTEMAPSVTTYSVTGTLARFSSEDRTLGDEVQQPADDGIGILTVPDRGFLRTDVSQVPAGVRSGAITVRLAIPAGMTLAADPDAAFLQLSDYSTSTAPLVAVSLAASRGSTQRATPYVNQTPYNPVTHEIFAVLVTPNSGGKGADQTAARVATSVANTSDYWGQQSEGTTHFHLAGTTSWYSSSYSCATDAGSTALWNQAAAVAASQLGYVADRNVHLVLFFPSSFMSSCGGAVGLGTVGFTANDGGAAWVVGTDSAISQGILSHELGHNMSLGHANWAHCPGTRPAFAGIRISENCATHPYGDLVDVMGYSQSGRTGGALSSPNAIRSGLWPVTAYENAPVGTNDFVLNAVSTNTGLRSVVIEDPRSGERWYVEYRNYTGEDQPYGTLGCNQSPTFTASSCAATTPGVRVLRVIDDYNELNFPGDNTILLGRESVSGAARLNYVAGETFTPMGAEHDAYPWSAEVKMEVLSVNGSQATVRITRPPLNYDGGSDTLHQQLRQGTLDIYPSINYDQQSRVGDVWTAFLGGSWSAEAYDFQWFRSLTSWPFTRTSIPGATGSSYALTTADEGYYIGVILTISATGVPPVSVSEPDWLGYGPVVKGIYRSDQPGAVAIDNSTTPVSAATSDWPAGTTFDYQWLRGASASAATTAIPGATAGSYSLAAADAGQFIRVRITATIPGYVNSVTRFSAASNFSLAAGAGSITVSGTPTVGLPVSAVNTIVYSSLGHTVAPTAFDYQWLRNGAVIAGATSSDFTPGSVDYGAKLSVRVTAHAPGYVPNTSVSAASAAIGKGALTGTFAIPGVTKDTSTSKFTLTGALPGGSIDTLATTTSYQWFRGAVAIAGATAATYAPTSADYGQLVSVKLTVGKLNYTSLTLQSTPINYSVVPSVGTPTITGELRVSQPVTVTDRVYVAGGAPTAAVEAIQWYRNGVAIAGPLGTGATYLLVAADLGKTLTARVTASIDGFLPAIGTSTPTQLVGSNSFDGWNAQEFASVAVTPSTNTLTVTGTGITGPGAPTVAYQWFRGTTAVAGAIKNTYALTAADYGLPVWVRVTTNRTGFTTIVKESTKVDYSITSDAPVISSAASPFRIGVALTADSSAFATKDGAITPSLAYQWFRNGVAIVGATSGTYLPVAADLATKLTVRVTAASPGFVAKVATSAPTVALAKGEIEGSFAAPMVSAAPTGVLTATVPVGSVTTPAPTTTWQWLRNGVAIAGATAATFALTAPDYGTTITVRATISKLNFTTRVLPDSVATDYSVKPDPLGALPLVTSSTIDTLGKPRVGATLSVTVPDYSTKDGPAAPTAAYQWLRNGVVIPASTQPTYLVLPSDLGTNLTVRVTAPVAGYVASVTVTPTLGVVVKGELSVTSDKPVVTASATGILSVAILPGTISQPAPTLTYQWKRDGANIVGATAATYTLTAADNGKLVSVLVKASKLNMVSTVPVELEESERTNYSIFLTDPIDPPTPFVYTIQGDVKVSETLSVTLPDYSTREGAVTPTLAYQWFRGATLIAGATQPTYVVQPADFGLTLQVRVTATTPRAIPNIALSGFSSTVLKGIIQGYGAPTVSSSATGKLTAVVPTTPPTTPGVTFAYQWLRDGAPIAGATTSTFQLSTLDYAKSIRVRVTITKANTEANAPAVSDAVNYSVLTIPDALPALPATPKVSELLSATLPDYSTADGPATPVLSYVWLRNGVAIPAATAPTYLLQPADFGTRISVRVTAALPGFVSSILTSRPTAPVATGVLVDFGSPVVSTSATGRLTATVPTVSTTTPGATFAYQWYRGAAPIAGATASTFQLTSLDYGKSISVWVTVSKANSTAFVGNPLKSSAADYSVQAPPDALPAVTGTLRVSELLSATLPDYSTLAGPASPTVTYVWLRNNVAIPGATGATYLLQPVDFGTSIRVRVTAAVPGYVPSVLTSAVITNIGKGAIAGFDDPTVSTSATGKLTAVLPTTAPTTPGVTVAYQWLRNGVAIVGATASTFQLTTADLDKDISVRVTISKANSDPPLQLSSIPTNYSVDRDADYALTGQAVSGDTRVGETLAVSIPSYSTVAGPATLTPTYQWLRNGVAIAGATGATYLVLPADFGLKISVRVTAALPGYVSRVDIVPPALPSAVKQGVLEVGPEPPVVTASAAGLLTATLPAAVSPGAALAYQWYRNNVAIVGATTNKYQLLAADSGRPISVKVTVSKANVVPPSDSRTSVGVDYGILADVPAISGDATVGVRLSAVLPSYTINGAPATPAVAYQWLRAGVAIAGATQPYYDTVVADLSKVISVRTTATQAGALTLVKTSGPTAALGLGAFGGDHAPPVVGGPPAAVLTASLPSGAIAETGVTLAYQWLRNGAAITGATAAAYALDPSLDYNTLTSVRITVSKAGYAALLLDPSVPADYSIHASGDVAIDNTDTTEGAVIGLATTPSYSLGADFWAPAPGDFSYQWYLNGVAVQGAAGVGGTYTVLASNLGKQLTVRITARSPGYLPVSSFSPPVTLGTP